MPSVREPVRLSAELLAHGLPDLRGRADRANARGLEGRGEGGQDLGLTGVGAGEFAVESVTAGDWLRIAELVSR